MLAPDLVVQNRTLTQIRRQGRVALYEVRGPGEALYGYEVILIKVRKAEQSFGRSYPEREVYPANEAWGTLGWSYGRNDLAGATERLNGLMERKTKAVA